MTKLVKNLIIGGTGTVTVAGAGTGVGVGVANKKHDDNAKLQAAQVAQQKAETQNVAVSNLSEVQSKVAAFVAQRNTEFHQQELSRIETLVRKYVAKENAKNAQEELIKTEVDVASYVANRNAEFAEKVLADAQAWVAQQNLEYRQHKIDSLEVKASLDHKKLESQKSSEVQEAVETTTEVNREDMIDTALAALEAKLNAMSAEQSVSQIDKQAQNKLSADQVKTAELDSIDQEENSFTLSTLRTSISDLVQGLMDSLHVPGAHLTVYAESSAKLAFDSLIDSISKATTVEDLSSISSSALVSFRSLINELIDNQQRQLAIHSAHQTADREFTNHFSSSELETLRASEEAARAKEIAEYEKEQQAIADKNQVAIDAEEDSFMNDLAQIARIEKMRKQHEEKKAWSWSNAKYYQDTQDYIRRDDANKEAASRNQIMAELRAREEASMEEFKEIMMRWGQEKLDADNTQAAIDAEEDNFMNAVKGEELASQNNKNAMDEHREAMLTLVRNYMRNDFYENLVVPEKEEDRLHPEYVKTLYLEFNEMLAKANSQEQLEQVEKEGNVMIAKALEAQKVQMLKNEMVSGLQLEFDKAHDNIWGLKSENQSDLFGKINSLFEEAKSEINAQQTHDDVVRTTLSAVAKFDDESSKLFTNEYNRIQKSLFDDVKRHTLQRWSSISFGFGLQDVDSKVKDELMSIEKDVVSKINAVSFDANNNESNIELIKSFALDVYKNMIELKNIEEAGEHANHGFHEAKPFAETQAKDVELARDFVIQQDSKVAQMTDAEFTDYINNVLHKEQPDVITTHSPVKIEVHNEVITYTTNSGAVITLEADQLDSAIFADKDGNIKPWWANVRSALVVYIDAQEAKNFKVATPEQLERMSEVEFNSYIRNVMYKEQPDAIFSNAKFELHDGVITYTTNSGEIINFKTFSSVHEEVFLHGGRETTPQWWMATQEALNIYWELENAEVKATQAAFYSDKKNAEQLKQLSNSILAGHVVSLYPENERNAVVQKVLDDIKTGKMSVDEAKEAYQF